MVRFASSIVNQETLHPRETITYFLRRRGFKTSNEIIEDEYLLFRVLSDQHFGDQIFFVDIISAICQYQGIYEASVDQRIVNSGRFQECKILRAFSLIYECNINLHQIGQELIIIGESAKPTREIDVLFYNNRYTSLVRIIQ
jgi:hypothetical protein